MSQSVESSPVQDPILPAEGLHVVHLFFRIDHGLWDLYDSRGRIEAKTAMAELVQEIRAEPGTQLLTFSIVSPKADVGFLLLTPDLHVADSFSKRLALALGPEVLTPEFACLSLTEKRGGTTSDADRDALGGGGDAGAGGVTASEEKPAVDRARVANDPGDGLTPHLPDWPVVCFYPMSLRRADGQNGPDARKQLVSGQAVVAASFPGRVFQMITGSTGLDDMEWGVTLFSRSTSEIHAIVSEMHSEKVAVRCADFGGCFIGIQMPLDRLFARLGL